MFCSQCGAQIPDSSNFCPKCGARAGGGRSAEPGGSRSDDTPLLTLKPQFVGWVTALSVVPAQLFFTVWGAGFFGGFGAIGVRVLGLDVPTWGPPVFFGCLFFFGLPLLVYTAKKRTYAQTEYRFYRTRLEYAEGFWTAENKTIGYDKITEAGLRRGVIQRRYGLGTIFLATPASGFQQGRARSGIRVRDVPDADKVYATVQHLIGN